MCDRPGSILTTEDWTLKDLKDDCCVPENEKRHRLLPPMEPHVKLLSEQFARRVSYDISDTLYTFRRMEPVYQTGSTIKPLSVLDPEDVTDTVHLFVGLASDSFVSATKVLLYVLWNGVFRMTIPTDSEMTYVGMPFRWQYTPQGWSMIPVPERRCIAPCVVTDMWVRGDVKDITFQLYSKVF